MYAQMGVEIIGQQTSLADVVSLFLDLCMCVYACATFVMFWGDPAPLNVLPQPSLLYFTEKYGGQGWATHILPLPNL